MANCPVCSAVMQDDFGLVNCQSCGSPVLLGMDGEVGIPDAPVEEPIQEEPPTLMQEVPEEPVEEIYEEPAHEEPVEEVVEEFLEDLPDTPPPNPADMSDVVEYANSDVSNGADGNLKFNLKISGIDTVDIKTGIKDVLADSKLHLDPETTLSRVESGELFLEGLSAVKCAILVQRLKSLSLDINWEQYAIQQA